VESDSRSYRTSNTNDRPRDTLPKDLQLPHDIQTDAAVTTSVWDDASIRAVLVAIVGNAIVTVAKFLGWLVSRSPSMLAESIHSLADTANQILLLIGIRHGAGRPTKEFPFGKGRARYIWNLISAVGIFFLGFGFTTWHGIEQLMVARTTDAIYSGPLPLAILTLALAIEGYTFFVALRSVNESRGEMGFWEFVRQGDDPTGVAVLLEDSIAVLGVFTAFVGISLSRHLQSPIPDAIASIAIGCLLGVMAIILAVANARILMGASVGQDREQEIREYLESLPAIERVTSLKTAVMAPGNVRLAAEIEFHGSTFIDRYMIERDADRIREGEDPTPVLFETAERMVRVMGREINRLEAQIRQEFPEISYIDLEVN
jgi:zinc transporter 9